MTDHCTTCGQPVPPRPIVPCNLCGHPCGVLGRDENDPGDRRMGLIEQTVHGGYWSTPGNGDGALDDCSSYKFSLCEFCLDWLFSRFAIPVATDSSIGPEPQPFRPAEQRVREDEWRKRKAEFFAEFEKRNASRKL